MVEEFMLLANISVAQKIYDEFSDCAMLRKHPAPPPSNYDILLKAAKSKVSGGGMVIQKQCFDFQVIARCFNHSSIIFSYFNHLSILLSDFSIT